MKSLNIKGKWYFDPKRDKDLLEVYSRFALLCTCFEEEQQRLMESLLQVPEGTSIQISILVGDDD